MIGPDTNVLVQTLSAGRSQLIAQSHPVIAKQCTRARCPRVYQSYRPCELVWVLESAYGYFKRHDCGRIRKAVAD